VSHILDRPAWNALHTSHAALAEGNSLAKRYPAFIVPFAAAATDTHESNAALTELAAIGEAIDLVEAGPISIPSSFSLIYEDVLVQMTAERPHQRINDSRVEILGEADTEDMLELATLAKPGPFRRGAQKLGPFWGVRMDRRLVAMGGQRLRVPGFTELSGLCTHPEYQGRGLGTLLFRFVAGEIAARDETAFLHVLASKPHAVALYETLGFSVRSSLNLRVIERKV
jgi:ribosomal protein S18 acetylase RimI-like enzyme